MDTQSASDTRLFYFVCQANHVAEQNPAHLHRLGAHQDSSSDKVEFLECTLSCNQYRWQSLLETVQDDPQCGHREAAESTSVADQGLIVRFSSRDADGFVSSSRNLHDDLGSEHH